MSYALSYSDQISLGMIDPEEPEVLTRCPGPAYPDSHGCGRFLSAHTSMCERCRDESEAYWAEDIARMAQLDAKFDAWNADEVESQLAQDGPDGWFYAAADDDLPY